MELQSKEARTILAVAAFKRDPIQHIRELARVYNVNRTTLTRRIHGRDARVDTIPKSRNLTPLEEEVIVRETLYLDSRGFPPRLRHVEDMANQLRTVRGASRVGKNWTSTFVKRQPELRTRFTRGYDYQRAQCEDPTIIQGWFDLVRNMVAKHGIQEEDIWNFDETGFMMGIISSAMVVTSSDGRGKAKMVQPGNREWATVIQAVNSYGNSIPPFIILAGKNHLQSWYRDSPLPPYWTIAVSENGWTTNELGIEWIKHFDKHTRERTKGSKRLLVLDGHESHHSYEFEEYCKDNAIITLCMPAHSSHILQPLDVGCFGPLKRAYGKQIEDLVRMHINHITKVEFLTAFKDAFYASFSEENVRGGFRGAGLVPFDPQSVISKLNVKLRTPTPPGSSSANAGPWVCKTPQTSYEANAQAEYIKNRISRHQSSSPTSIYGAMDQMLKGASTVMHRMVLMEDRINQLESANRTLSKRRREKKTRVREGGTLTIEDAKDLIEQKEVVQQVEGEMRANSGRARRTETAARRCGNCHATGHNARTCPNDRAVSV